MTCPVCRVGIPERADGFDKDGNKLYSAGDCFHCVKLKKTKKKQERS